MQFIEPPFLLTARRKQQFKQILVVSTYTPTTSNRLWYKGIILDGHYSGGNWGGSVAKVRNDFFIQRIAPEEVTALLIGIGGNNFPGTVIDNVAVTTRIN
jgi:hypothetical protein